MHPNYAFPQVRLRRLRAQEKIRHLVQDVSIDIHKLVLPLFIKQGIKVKNKITAMPGHFQLSLDNLSEELETISNLGIKNIILFGIPAEKNNLGTDSYSESGIIQTAIRFIKKIAPHLLIMSDICLCEYTDHGHCGVIRQTGNAQEVFVDNDKTIALLAKQAVSHAAAGTDIIAPSANMDGMVQAIRTALDDAGYESLPILSYAVKYASALYGPFRLAAEGNPKIGDRKTYQMDFTNKNQALGECELDIREGADMLMIKPAHTYLDIISRIKSRFPHLPLGAYHTSGEFAMLKAAALQGWLDEKKSVLEVLSAIHRAGADFIFTYYAKEVAKWMQE